MSLKKGYFGHMARIITKHLVRILKCKKNIQHVVLLLSVQHVAHHVQLHVHNEKENSFSFLSSRLPDKALVLSGFFFSDHI